jgi:hypothetical protein
MINRGDKTPSSRTQTEPAICQRQQLPEIFQSLPIRPTIATSDAHTAVATTVVRSGARPARWMGDITPAGLLTRGSDALLRLPVRCSSFARTDAQWLSGSRLAAYSCGGSHGLRIAAIRHRVPSCLRDGQCVRPGTDMQRQTIKVPRASQFRSGNTGMAWPRKLSATPVRVSYYWNIRRGGTRQPRFAPPSTAPA